MNLIIDFLNKVYPLKKCATQSFPEGSGHCLNYHINLCRGVCDGKTSPEEYGEMIREVLDFLQGNSREMEKRLKTKMEEASEALDFEKAAEYRDDIIAIQMLREKQKIVTSASNEVDVIVSADVDEGTNIMLFYVRDGKMTGRESYRIGATVEQSREEKIAAFMKQYYCDGSLIPKEILVESMGEEFPAIEAWLSEVKGSKVKIFVPQKGDKKALLEMGILNVTQTLETFEKRVKNRQDKTERLEAGLQKLLGLDRELRRIEAYDISNTSGVHSVGGMVVFENGMKRPKDYRKFKIKTIEGPNDYGSLQEVIYRRFKNYKEALKTGRNNGFERLPDLLLIDGGDKQAAAVEAVTRAMGIDVPVVGMVKDDKHRTRDLVIDGRLCGLKENDEVFKFIYFIQEEVHRFSIDYHKSLRSKAMTKSVLDEIPGIGEKRRNQLLEHFGSVEKIKQATVEELEKAPGMNKRVAEAVKEHFNSKKTEP